MRNQVVSPQGGGLSPFVNSNDDRSRPLASASRLSRLQSPSPDFSMKEIQIKHRYKQATPRVQSLNSIPYTEKEIRQVIDFVLEASHNNSTRRGPNRDKGQGKDHLHDKGGARNPLQPLLERLKIGTTPVQMPPTRDSFKLLCKYMNLKVTTRRCIDAILYCRGPKLEEEDPSTFSMDKLIKWFLVNAKVLEHEDKERADPTWLQSARHRESASKLKMPMKSFRPNPRNFLRKFSSTAEGGRPANNSSTLMQIANLDMERNLQPSTESQETGSDEEGVFQHTLPKIPRKKNWERLLEMSQEERNPFTFQASARSRTGPFDGKIMVHDVAKSGADGLPPVENWNANVPPGGGLRKLVSPRPGTYEESESHSYRSPQKGGPFITQRVHPTQPGYQAQSFKLALELDSGFQQEIDNAILNIERNPGMRSKVVDKLSAFHMSIEQERGHRGIIGGEMARQRVLQRKKDEALSMDRRLNSMVLETSKTSALQAINLNQLLKKKWTEETNAYQILSKIKTEKQSRRLEKLMRDPIY